VIPVEPGVPAEVGRRITVLRRSAGLSLSELARRAGLGKGTLSELEAGRRNPTLETLYALTAPLGVGLASLIDVGRVGDRARGAVIGDGVSAVLLDVIGEPGDAAITEVYRLVIDAGARRLSPPHGAGVAERLTGVSGRALVGPLGAQRSVAAGKTVSWISDVEHSFEAVGDQPCVGVLLITHPAVATG
jgi:transcriptional regulator with XRE-family HTH domain